MNLAFLFCIPLGFVGAWGVAVIKEYDLADFNCPPESESRCYYKGRPVQLNPDDPATHIRLCETAPWYVHKKGDPSDEKYKDARFGVGETGEWMTYNVVGSILNRMHQEWLAHPDTFAQSPVPAGSARENFVGDSGSPMHPPSLTSRAASPPSTVGSAQVSNLAVVANPKIPEVPRNYDEKEFKCHPRDAKDKSRKFCYYKGHPVLRVPGNLHTHIRTSGSQEGKFVARRETLDRDGYLDRSEVDEILNKMHQKLMAQDAASRALEAEIDAVRGYIRKDFKCPRDSKSLNYCYYKGQPVLLVPGNLHAHIRQSQSYIGKFVAKDAGKNIVLDRDAVDKILAGMHQDYEALVSTHQYFDCKKPEMYDGEQVYDEYGFALSSTKRKCHDDRTVLDSAGNLIDFKAMKTILDIFRGPARKVEGEKEPEEVSESSSGSGSHSDPTDKGYDMGDFQCPSDLGYLCLYKGRPVLENPVDLNSIIAKMESNYFVKNGRISAEKIDEILRSMHQDYEDLKAKHHCFDWEYPHMYNGMIVYDEYGRRMLDVERMFAVQDSFYQTIDFKRMQKILNTFRDATIVTDDGHLLYLGQVVKTETGTPLHQSEDLNNRGVYDFMAGDDVVPPEEVIKLLDAIEEKDPGRNERKQRKMTSEGECKAKDTAGLDFSAAAASSSHEGEGGKDATAHSESSSASASSSSTPPPLPAGSVSPVANAADVENPVSPDDGSAGVSSSVDEAKEPLGEHHSLIPGVDAGLEVDTKGEGKDEASATDAGVDESNPEAGSSGGPLIEPTLHSITEEDFGFFNLPPEVVAIEAVTKSKEDSNSPSKTKTDRSSSSEPKVDSASSSESKAESFPLVEANADLSLPSEAKVDSSPPAESKADLSLPSESKADSISPAEAKADPSSSSESKVDSASSSESKVDSSPPAESKADLSLPSETKADLSLSSESKADLSLPSESKADFPFPEAKADSPPPEAKADSSSPSGSKADSSSPSEPKAATPPAKTKAGSSPPSSESGSSSTEKSLTIVGDTVSPKGYDGNDFKCPTSASGHYCYYKGHPVLQVPGDAVTQIKAVPGLVGVYITDAKDVVLGQPDVDTILAGMHQDYQALIAEHSHYQWKYPEIYGIPGDAYRVYDEFGRKLRQPAGQRPGETSVADSFGRPIDFKRMKTILDVFRASITRDVDGHVSYSGKPVRMADGRQLREGEPDDFGIRHFMAGDEVVSPGIVIGLLDAIEESVSDDFEEEEEEYADAEDVPGASISSGEDSPPADAAHDAVIEFHDESSEDEVTPAFVPTAAPEPIAVKGDEASASAFASISIGIIVLSLLVTM